MVKTTQELNEDIFTELVKNDQEAISLLKKLVASNIPLTIDDLPCCDYVSVNTNLHRLFELEKHGWVVLCDRSIPEGGLVKTFDITEKGRDLLKVLI